MIGYGLMVDLNSPHIIWPTFLQTLCVSQKINYHYHTTLRVTGKLSQRFQINEKSYICLMKRSFSGLESIVQSTYYCIIETSHVKKIEYSSTETV